MDLDRRDDGKQIDVMQDDKYSRELELHLQANGKPYCPPEDCVVLVRYQGNYGHGGAYDLLPDGRKAWRIQENILTVTLAPQVCTVAGKVMMTVTLRRGSAELSCFTVCVNVHKGPGTDLKSEPYYHINGFIPQPDSAKAGDFLKVVSVDSQGNIKATTGDARRGKSAYQQAVEGGYTGSEVEFSRKLAQDYSDTYISLNVTGASVGQTVRIAAVDDDGKPTAWESVDFTGGDGFAEEEYIVKLSITGFTRPNGTFSPSASGYRTDYLPMDGVAKISGNAGLYSDCMAIAFYDRNKKFLTDISVLGSVLIETAGSSYGEGVFELDVSGEEFADAAYFVISTYRLASGVDYTQTFVDDYCKYTKLVEGESNEKPYYRISQNSIVFFGDSITAGIGGCNYPSLIASITGAKVTNRGKSGATLATGTTATYHISDLVAEYTGADDIICISGGINDFNISVPIGTLTAGYDDELDTTTVIGALENIFRELLTNHTTAKIYYVITHKAASAEINRNNLGLTFTDYHDAIVSVLNKYSIPFYDAFEDSGFVTSSYGAWGETIRNLYTVNADGVHPNEAGYLKYYVYQIIDMM